jgi:hypothetical protein
MTDLVEKVARALSFSLPPDVSLTGTQERFIARAAIEAYDSSILHVLQQARESKAEIGRLREIIAREKDIICMYGTDESRAALEKGDG